jgi:hypothetical protein
MPEREAAKTLHCTGNQANSRPDDDALRSALVIVRLSALLLQPVGADSTGFVFSICSQPWANDAVRQEHANQAESDCAENERHIASSLMDGFHAGAKQQNRFIIARRPSRVAIDALPADIELRIDQHHGFRVPALRAYDALCIEDLVKNLAPWHI